MIKKYLKRTDKFIWATIAAPILFLILFCSITLSGIQDDHYAVLITSAGGTATLYIGLVKYWIDSDTMFKSLFTEFNARFDKINQGLNLIAAGAKVNGERTEEQIIQDYLNLCAEEYYWYSRGRVPEAVWSSWSAGIKGYLEVPQIRDFFRSQLPHDTSYYGFLKVVNQSL